MACYSVKFAFFTFDHLPLHNRTGRFITAGHKHPTLMTYVCSYYVLSPISFSVYQGDVFQKFPNKISEHIFYLT
jgi:hypothetical protein